MGFRRYLLAGLLIALGLALSIKDTLAFGDALLF